MNNAVAGFGPERAEDIREQLRKDHELALAELDALGRETDEHRCKAQLVRLRQSWIIHALAEESVVYRALEGLHASTDGRNRADERFVEHELVGGLFDKLLQMRRATLEWPARLNVVRDLIARHIQTEHDEMFKALGARFDARELLEMGQRFEMARNKLLMLEQAKAA